jgi:hypothetical protein
MYSIIRIYRGLFKPSCRHVGSIIAMSREVYIASIIGMDRSFQIASIIGKEDRRLYSQYYRH